MEHEIASRRTRGSGRRRTPRAELAVAVVLVLGGASLACGRASGEDPYRAALARLEAIPTRPVEGRLLGAPHRPYRPPRGRTRGAAGEESPLRGGRDASQSRLTPGEREALAIDWLAADRVDGAAELLATLADQAPVTPRVLHGLAVARIENALRSGDPVLALTALGDAERAFAADPSDEARWNRALALATVPLPRRAAQAWSEVIAHDASPEWVAEARAAQTESRPAPRTRRSDLPPPEPRTPGTAGEGARDLVAAIDLWRSEDRRGAAAAFGRARSKLVSIGGPLALRARLGVVQTAGVVPWSELGDLVELTAGRGDALEGAVLRQAGLRNGREGRTAAAVGWYRRAEAAFASADHDEAATVAASLAEIYAEAHDDTAAWQALGRALERSPRVADPFQRYSLFVIAASALRQLDPWAAVEVRREAAETCADLPERPLCAVDSAIAIADRLLALEASPEEIAGELDRAEGLLASGVGSRDGRAESEADWTAEAARWLAAPSHPSRDLPAAVERMERARSAYWAAGRVPPYLRATDELAGWLTELGRTSEVEELIDAARVLLRDRTAPAKALGLASPARSLYQRAIASRLAAGADLEALDLVEEMSSLGQPAGAIRAMAPDTAAAVYWTGGEPAVAWLVTAAGRERVPLLGAAVSELEIALRQLPGERSEEGWRRGTAEIYSRWLAPLIARLPPGITRLVIVPDQAVADVPFRALWDRERGRYLEDTLSVELIPRLGAVDAVEEHSSDPRTILSLGIARFEPVLALGGLAAAPAEATAVAAAYPRRLGCDGARWRDFLACADGAEVIHLATHARAQDSREGGSWIAFADETVGLERLRAELPPLPHTRLVVLSACQSSRTAGGTLGGLAPPFLSAGVRTVVGSLWPVEDTALLGEFMAAFHESYRQSGQAAAALRVARSAHPALAVRPWLWGAFTIVSRPPTGGS